MRRQIYEERTNHLVEITSQAQVNLDNALDTQRRYLTTAVNILEEQDLDSVTEAVAYINELERAASPGGGERPFRHEHSGGGGNEINAEILSELLNAAGAKCEICENGQKAVEAFERSAPGQYLLILMDIRMPVMDGYEATRRIRDSSHPAASAIPIVAMAANAFAEDVRGALAAGMNAHAAKPIDMSALERTVRAVLEGQPDRQAE